MRGDNFEGVHGELILYETEDGRTRVECRFAEETLWLSQALMAELFQTTPQNITLHLKALHPQPHVAGGVAGCRRIATLTGMPAPPHGVRRPLPRRAMPNRKSRP